MQDKINFLLKLNIRKGWQVIKSLLLYHYSRLLKRPVVPQFPVGISIETTTCCNLACYECPLGQGQINRANKHMPWSMYQKIIDQAYKHTSSLLLYFQGEPFIAPDIFKQIAYAHQKKIYTISSTNGHFLNTSNCIKIISSGLNRIIISLDGITHDVYTQYRRNGDLVKVLNGIKELVKWKKKLGKSNPLVIIQFLIFKYNEHQINDIKSFFKTSGADKLQLKKPQIYHFNDADALLPSSQYSRYIKNTDNNYIIKGRLKNACKRLWQSMVFTVEGDVVPCCFDKHADHKFGNIKDDELTAIWRSGAANEFRKNILTNRMRIGICNNCTEGINIYK